MLKVDEIKEGIIKITPPADDFNCISSNIFFLTKEGILIDAGGQHYSEEIENIINLNDYFADFDGGSPNFGVYNIF